jgi:hypothetical protein
MGLTTLTFGGDEIVNLPYTTPPSTSSPLLASLQLGAQDFIYAYDPSSANFASVTAVAPGASNSLVTLVLTLQDVGGPTLTKDHETLFAGGTSAVWGRNSVISFVGSAAAATSFLDNAYIVDTTASDNFAISITATEAGSTASFSTFYQMACFVTGTHLSTPDGERRVEELAVGDLVATRDGERRVAWIGARTYEAGMLEAEPWLRPVEIRRGALGRGLPRRDLRVSPEHAILIDGVLVRAAALVNGRTIFHAPAASDVTYYHVELENEHGILFAEGAPTESFRDEGSRVLFDNAAEYTLSHGTSSSLPPPAAPRVDEGYQLEAIRHRLSGGMDEVPAGSIRGHVERLTDGVLEGWIMDAANPLVPVEIEVRVDGKPVGRTIANAYRADLHRAGIGVGRAGFRFVLPAGCDDLGTVTVVRAFDGARLPVAEQAAA